MQETSLAWALMEAAKSHLSARERNDAFVIIGADDTSAVIRRLFKLVVVKQIPLRADLVQRCSTWLDTYSRHEEEQYLRRLVARFLIGYTQTSISVRRDRVEPQTPPWTQVPLLAVRR